MTQTNEDYIQFLHQFLSDAAELDNFLGKMRGDEGIFDNKHISQLALNPYTKLHFKMELICNYFLREEFTFTFKDNIENLFGTLESFRDDLFSDLRHIDWAYTSAMTLENLFYKLKGEIPFSEIRLCKIINDIVMKYHKISQEHLTDPGDLDSKSDIIKSIFASKDEDPHEIGRKVQAFLDTLRNDNYDVAEVLRALSERLSPDIMQNVDNMPPKASVKRAHSDQDEGRDDEEELGDHTKRQDTGSTTEYPSVKAVSEFEDTLLCGADSALLEDGV